VPRTEPLTTRLAVAEYETRFARAKIKNSSKTLKSVDWIKALPNPAAMHGAERMQSTWSCGVSGR
jgi:hypothetical protein